MEFAYTPRSHRFCLNIAGGTQQTEIFHGTRRTYAGQDRAGLLTVVPSEMDRRSVVRDADFEYLRFEISTECFERLASSIFADIAPFDIRPLDNQELPRLQWIGAQMRRLLGDGGDMLSFDLLAVAFTHVVLTMNGLRGTSPSVWGLDARALMRVRDYVYAHLDGPLRLEALAEQAGLGPMPFVRAFRATTGRTPGRFVTEARMERAKDLLRDPELDLLSVAIRTGYRTHSHFTASFRKTVGLTPSAYRRRLGG